MPILGGTNCGNAAWAISIMGGQDLTHERRWSVGQILLLLLGVALVFWGAVAKIAFILVRLLQGSGG